MKKIPKFELLRVTVSYASGYGSLAFARFGTAGGIGVPERFSAICTTARSIRYWAGYLDFVGVGNELSRQDFARRRRSGGVLRSGCLGSTAGLEASARASGTGDHP